MNTMLYRNLHNYILYYKTIQAYSGGRNWRALPIKECGEPLVLIPPEFNQPFYVHEARLISDERIFLREKLFEMFLRARSILLEEGFDLKIYDGWRSIDLQEKIFWLYLKQFTAKRFNLEDYFDVADTPDEIRDMFLKLSETIRITMTAAHRQYVSWPSADPNCPSPHVTGGSIDVWPYKDGHPVNLGVPFDWMEEEAGAFYQLKLMRNRFAGNDNLVSKNRNLLIWAMSTVGFSCYGPEIWHYSYGNQMDSLVSGKVACYSYTEPKDMV